MVHKYLTPSCAQQWPGMPRHGFYLNSDQRIKWPRYIDPIRSSTPGAPPGGGGRRGLTRKNVVGKPKWEAYINIMWGREKKEQ